jgi:hypothetical protein
MNNNKKNILYLGPYKQVNYLGQCSLRNLYEILQLESVNVVSKHISVDNSDVLDTSHIIPKHHESIDNVSGIDMIIQNLPTSFISSNFYAKNVVIPFVDPYIDYSNSNMFSHFDMVLIDDQYSRDKIKNKHTKIEIYDQQPPIILNSCNTEKYSLGAYSNLYKFGFIANYQKEVTFLQKLIQSFLTTFRASNKVSLYLLVTATDQERAELESSYEDIKKSLSMIGYDKIVFMYNNCDHMDSIRFLNSLDCYISLNSYTKYSMYEKYCTQINRSYITHKDINSLNMPIMPTKTVTDLKSKYCSPTSDSVSQALTQSLNKQIYRKNKNTNQTLSNLICKLI